MAVGFSATPDPPESSAARPVASSSPAPLRASSPGAPGGPDRSCRRTGRCGASAARPGATQRPSVPDASAASASASQSRGRRKSVARRASGVPGSGCPVGSATAPRSAASTSGWIRCAPPRLQTEQRAAVPDQVELDVATTPVEPGSRVRARRTGHIAAALRDRQPALARSASPTSLQHREAALRSPAPLKSSKKMPPMPRGSSRCFRKKYSSHHFLKRGYLSSPKGASASRQPRWKCTASSSTP